MFAFRTLPVAAVIRAAVFGMIPPPDLFMAKIEEGAEQWNTALG